MTYSRGRSGLRVGILSIAGTVSFAGLFFYSTNRVLGAVRSTIYVRLNAADGLQRGDAVLHRGVDVGDVKAIEFADDDVVIRVRLTQAVPVSAGARAAMVAADIFGRQSIVIRDDQPSPRPLMDGDTIAGAAPVSMTARFEDLGERVGDLLSERTLADVHTTLSGAGAAAASAAGAASRISNLAENADALIAEQRPALAGLTQDAGLLIRDIRDAARPAELALLQENLRIAAQNLAAVTTTMDSAATRLTRILEDVESGRGSAGRLLTDPELYERATGSLVALEQLLDDVRRNPKRYVTIKVF